MSPTSSKSWYRRFRFSSKETQIGFGSYPAVYTQRT
ncbi:Arm DNA-binding domain-containing protein [Gilliamella apicola]